MGGAFRQILDRAHNKRSGVGVMSATTTAPPSDLLAIAFVVEASLTISRQWQHIVQDYIGVMVKRLNENYPAHKVLNDNCLSLHS